MNETKAHPDSGERLDISPEVCASRVKAVQTRCIRLGRTLAVSLLAGVLSISLTAAILLDAWIRGGFGCRLVLMAVAMAPVIWAYHRNVLPLWKTISVKIAALLIERKYPDLRGRLITAIQLADPSRRRAGGVSDALYTQVRESAEAAAGHVELSAVVPGKRVWKRIVTAWAVLIAAVALAAANPASAGIGLVRVLLPWEDVNWPKRTHIRIAEISNRVVRGGTLTLSGTAEGVIPSNGMLRVRAGQGAADRAYFEVNADGRFDVQYRPVTQDLDVWVEIGDNATAPVRVTMVPPPEIARIQAECVYPDFTHQEKQTIEDGNVQAVLGTRVTLRITANKSVTEAQLAWEDGKSVAMEVDSRPGAATTFNVEASRSYRINLTDENGFHNADPVIYRIEMTDNQYPQFDRVSPAIDRRVTPQAVLPVSAEISDDYGVTGLTLCHRSGNAADVGRIDMPLAATGKHVTVRYDWAIEPLGLKPGDSLTYWLEARDEGEHAVKHEWPISRPRKLKLMSEVELARALSDELEQIMDKLAQLESLQAESAETVKRIAGTAESDRSASVQERTRAEKWRQDRLARTTGQLGDLLGRVADDYAASRIGQEDRWLRLRATADRLGRLAGSDMPAIVLALEDALNSLRGGGAMITTQPGEDNR